LSAGEFLIGACNFSSHRSTNHEMKNEPAPGSPQSKSGFLFALKVATQFHFSPFKVYVNRPQRTVVILNPKVGTQSFRYILNRGLREQFGWKDASNGRYRLFKNAREFSFAPLRDYLHALSNQSDYEFFCFVRNPYARLRSAWLDKLAFGHEQGYPRSTRHRVIGPLRAFARAKKLAGGDEGTPIPFSTFVAYVEQEPPGKRDHHWDEQYSVLLMDFLRYNRVFKLETEFGEGVVHILTRIGFEKTWIERTMQQPRNESAKFNETVFDADLATRVARIYSRDFPALGYPIDSWHGL
jgi:hypothetical protein